MKQKTHDNSTPGQGVPDKTSGDGILKDLAEKAKTMAAALDDSNTGDPRRRGEIKVIKRAESKYDLFIDDVLWSEVEWGGTQHRWCIQDCCGYCLMHIDHVHATAPNDGTPDIHVKRTEELNGTAAIEMAKQMIRDGSLPAPEAAKATFKKTYGRDFTNR
jgi:hypothetical protein